MCKIVLFLLLLFSVYVSCTAENQDEKISRLEARLQQLESRLEDYESLKSNIEALSEWKENQREEKTVKDLPDIETSKSRDLEDKVVSVENNVKGLNDWKTQVDNNIHGMKDKVVNVENNVKGLNDWKTQVDNNIHGMKEEVKNNKFEEKVQNMNKHLDELKTYQEEIEKKLSDFTKETNRWKEKEVKMELDSMLGIIDKIQGNLSSFQKWQSQHEIWRNSKVEPQFNNITQNISQIESLDSDILQRVEKIEKEVPDLRGNLNSAQEWIEDYRKTWKEWREDISSWLHGTSTTLNNFEGRISTLDSTANDMLQWQKDVGFWQNEIKNNIKDLNSWKQNNVEPFNQKIEGRVKHLETDSYDIKNWKVEISTWRSNTDDYVKGLNSWRTDIDTWKNTEVTSKLTDYGGRVLKLENDTKDTTLWRGDMSSWQDDVKTFIIGINSWRENDIVPFTQSIKGRVEYLEKETSDIKDWKGLISIWKSSTDDNVEGFKKWRTTIDTWKNTEVTSKLTDHNARVSSLESDGEGLAIWKIEISSWQNDVNSWKENEIVPYVKGLNSWRTNIESWRNTEVTSKLTDYGARVLTLENDVKDITIWRGNVSSWQADVIEKEWGNVLSEIKTLVRKVTWLEISGGDTSFLLYLMVTIIVAMVGLLVLILMRTRSLGNTAAHTQYGSIPQTGHPSILDNIHAKVEEDSICVVSFHTNTQGHHKQLTENITRSHSSLRKFPVHTFLVHGHENLPSMHLSKLFIVYVDHNERNIILEDPDQELGDLRRTTVQAAIKMGACVFVVYTHDRGSENLKEGQLYNERLISITKHTVLSPLSEKHQVLSINTDYTTYQRTHLQEKMCDVLDKKNK